MATFVLTAVLLLSLLSIPLGLPGTWIMFLAGLTYTWAVGGNAIGWVPLAGCFAIAVTAEVLDVTLAGRYTKKYGGSRRGAWGAIIGGVIGAIVGVPVPILGPVIGAIVGSFAGALVGEYSGGMGHQDAAKAATGAAIGRVVAMGAKAAAGCVIAAWLLGAALI